MRLCDTCRQPLSLRDLNFGSDLLGVVCLSCAHERASTEARHAQIDALEKVRESLIVSLGAIDVQIDVARADRLPQMAALERQRRTLIASLVKIDTEVAKLCGVGHSSPFSRVESADVFGGTDGADGGSDGDVGFGD